MAKKKLIVPTKEVTQSYIWSVARYDADAYEKRVLYRMIEAVQWVAEGKKHDKPYEYYQGRNVFKDFTFRFPTSHFLMGDEQNHAKIHKALKSLRQRTIAYHNPGTKEDGAWIEYVGFIERPKYGHERGWVEFAIPECVAEGLLHFTEGFRRYELLTAMSLKSVYAMRFYELFSGQESPIIFSIEDLRKMFGLEGKYKDKNDFIKRVIVSAKKELDECAPYSFDFRTNQDIERSKGNRCRSIEWIRFTPYKIHRETSDEIERNKLKMQISSSFTIGEELRQYLIDNWDFTEKELRANQDKLEGLPTLDDPLHFLSTLRGPSRVKYNPKGWVLRAIETAIEQQRGRQFMSR